MRSAAVILVLGIMSAVAAFAARADDAATSEAINKAAAALDQAFAKDDAAALKALMTSDHIAVAPYIGGPQSVADQIASLSDLKYEQTIIGDVSVVLLGPEAAMRSFTAEAKGSFQGHPIPRHVFVSAIWVKQNGTWLEKFYQATALRPAGEQDACRRLVGSYLTKNFAKGTSADAIISRSVLSLDRSGLMLFTDSGEGGAAGFAPFTDGRGAWDCVAREDGTAQARATTLDFTDPSPDHPKADIGRLDFAFTSSPGTDTLKGTATLHLVPIGSDPLDERALTGGRQFDITAERIEAP